jgi:hypothetical protein
LKTKIVSNQTLLQLFDKFAYELEDNEKQVKLSNISEVYYVTLKHPVVAKEVDTSVIHERIKHQIKIEKVQAKDIFNMLEVIE